MMKIWKMIACLLLLCVLIGGCVILGTASSSALQDEEMPTESNNTENAEQNGENNLTEDQNEEVSGTVTVTPVYSEGLRFRSNGDGTCAVAGIGSCTSSCILIPPTSPAGDTVVEVLPYAFQDSIVGAIELPAGVQIASALSFAGCQRLAYVRVASGNTNFLEQDGVLYSADGKTLIYCPAGRTASELTLHASLARIAAGAFAECQGLTTVVFQGSTAAWHSVIVGDDNAPLYAAGFRFSV